MRFVCLLSRFVEFSFELGFSWLLDAPKIVLDRPARSELDALVILPILTWLHRQFHDKPTINATVPVRDVHGIASEHVLTARRSLFRTPHHLERHISCVGENADEKVDDASPKSLFCPQPEQTLSWTNAVHPYQRIECLGPKTRSALHLPDLWIFARKGAW